VSGRIKTTVLYNQANVIRMRSNSHARLIAANRTDVTSVFSSTVEKGFPPVILSAYLRIICTTAGWKRSDRSFTGFKKYT